MKKVIFLLCINLCITYTIRPAVSISDENETTTLQQQKNKLLKLKILKTVGHSLGFAAGAFLSFTAMTSLDDMTDIFLILIGLRAFVGHYQRLATMYKYLENLQEKMPSIHPTIQKSLSFGCNGAIGGVSLLFLIGMSMNIPNLIAILNDKRIYPKLEALFTITSVISTLWFSGESLWNLGKSYRSA